MTPHPNEEQLLAFGIGALLSTDHEAVENHVAECDSCCQKLATVPPDSLIDLLQTVAATMAGTAIEDKPPKSPDAKVCELEVPAALASHPRYRILGALGSGGFGTVFKAEHRLMRRIVALKVLRKDLIDRPAAVERFRLEVQAAAKLAHPNIVTAFDAEQAGGVHFLVMEFVEGTNLHCWLEQHGPVTVDQSCRWMQQAALGLQHAFERGMVHRDIKPGNMLLTPRDEIKILDFGLARFASECEPSAALTQSGMVMGTPDYIAPEQARDPHQADIRADIYSLGCTLYCLLAGRPPFIGGTVMQKLLAHQDRQPRPLTDFRSDVPPELVHILDRMLAKDPAQRYETPAEIVTEFETILRVSDECAPARSHTDASRHRRAYVLIAAALLVVLVGAGAISWLLWQGLSTAARPEHHETPAVLTANSEHEHGQPVASIPSPPAQPKALPTSKIQTDPQPFQDVTITLIDPSPRYKYAQGQAIAWLRANTSGTNPTIAMDAEKDFAARSFNTGFLFILGSQLTKSGRTSVVTGWSGEWFAFELSEEQARTHGYASKTLTKEMVSRDSSPQSGRQFVKLENPRLEPVAERQPGGEVKGWVSCTKLEQIPSQLAFRIIVLMEKDAVRYYQKLELPISSNAVSLPFSLGHIDEKMCRVVFIQVIPLDDPYKRFKGFTVRDPYYAPLVSNTVATLVDVAARDKTK